MKMSYITQCAACGSTISCRAGACPRCGHPAPTSTVKIAARIIALMMALSGGICAMGGERMRAAGAMLVGVAIIILLISMVNRVA